MLKTYATIVSVALAAACLFAGSTPSAAAGSVPYTVMFVGWAICLLLVAILINLVEFEEETT